MLAAKPEPESVTVILTATLEEAVVRVGGVATITGPVLSTINVVLGPAAGAVFPDESDAVPAAMLIPSVPSPVIPLIVIVLVVVPVPDTATVPVSCTCFI